MTVARSMSGPANPTETIDIDFPEYLERRSRLRAAHLIDGVADYSFSLDRRLRSRLSAIAPLRELAHLAVRSQEPFMQQLHSMNGIAVTPEQFPKLFKMGVHCAHRL